FVSQPAVSTDPSSTRVYETGLLGPQDLIFSSGRWADSGTMHADAIVYGNPNGIASGMQFRVSLGDSTLASANINAQLATAGYIKIPTTFAAQPWPAGSSLAGSFAMQPDVTPANNSNLIIAGVRYYTGQSGFQ